MSLDHLEHTAQTRSATVIITELREVINIASVACQLGVYGAVEKLRAFDWTGFSSKAHYVA